MADHNKVRISERELDLMRALWDMGEASVGDVHARLAGEGSDLAYTTVQTMLNRLEAKGLARRRLEGRAYRYSPSMKEPRAAQAALRRLIDRFFSGSPADLAIHLVENEMSERDLERVNQLLREQRTRGGRR